VAPRRLLRPAVPAGGAVAVVGFLLAAISTNLAIAAGEQPVTLLPAGAGGRSLVAILIVRAVAVVLLVTAVRRWQPRRLVAYLAVSGLFWVLLGAWQAWLMLART
jgi:hypothetical protein